MKQRLIIVGNGSSVLDKENGSLIDSFDNVVRFNSYKIKNFEKYVGTKTDIWITVNAAHINEIQSYKRVIEHSWQWSEDKDKIFQKIKKLRSDCLKIPKELVRNKEPLKFIKSPSTGLIAIQFFLEENNYQMPIYITGFDWWENRKIHHYGDREKVGTIHEPKKEKKIIDDLVSKNLVKFL